ncbi:MAG: hypothetical protein ACYSUI_05255 [Planctomycetota bacterium]|jgi:hypothetical protein
MMLAQLLAQAVGPGDRIDAVHTHFSGRSSSDGLNVFLTTLALAVVLSGVLLLLSRVQRAKQRREERAQDQRRHDLVASHRQSAQPTPEMTLLKKRPAVRGR